MVRLRRWWPQSAMPRQPHQLRVVQPAQELGLAEVCTLSTLHDAAAL